MFSTLAVIISNLAFFFSLSLMAVLISQLYPVLIFGRFVAGGSAQCAVKLRDCPESREKSRLAVSLGPVGVAAGLPGTARATAH